MLLVFVLTYTIPQLNSFDIIDMDMDEFRTILESIILVTLFFVYLNFANQTYGVLMPNIVKIKENYITLALTYFYVAYMLLANLWSFIILVYSQLQEQRGRRCGAFLGPFVTASWYFREVGCLVQSLFVMQVLSQVAPFVRKVNEIDLEESIKNQSLMTDAFKMDTSLAEDVDTVPEL